MNLSKFERKNLQRLVVACADSLIEQAERKAKGWDKGIYRDDAAPGDMPINVQIRGNVKLAFNAAKELVA